MVAPNSKESTIPPTKVTPNCILCKCNIRFVLSGKQQQAIHVWRNGEREPCRDPELGKKLAIFRIENVAPPVKPKKWTRRRKQITAAIKDK